MTRIYHTKRIDEIDLEILKLNQERSALRQEEIDSISQFKIGDLIKWEKGNKFAMGRVLGIGIWVSDNPQWFVKNIRKDGIEGCRSTVYPYNSPTKIENLEET